MMNTGRLEVPSSGCLLPYSYKQAGISKSNLGEGILISYLNNDKVIMYCNDCMFVLWLQYCLKVWIEEIPLYA